MLDTKNQIIFIIEQAMEIHIFGSYHNSSLVFFYL